MKPIREGHVLVLLVVLGLIVSGINPVSDRTTWFLEVLPVVLILPSTILLQPKLQLTHWTLRFMVLHAFVLILGGHYTYADVPIGETVREAFHLTRNPYDRFGHFMQGFVPAFVYREMFLKKTTLKPSLFTNVVVVAFCLAFSALYELLEFASAVALGQGADAFLGTQGDQWDTQWDMLWALIGAILALPLAAKVQGTFESHSF